MKNKLLILFTLIGTIGISFLMLAGCGSKKADKDTQQAPADAASSETEEAKPSDSPATLTTAPTPEEVTPTPEKNILSEKEFIPSEENVKLLGRTYLLGDNLWLSYSASGIEFTFTGTKAELTLIGDNMAVGLDEIHFCRIGIYVNGELVKDELLKEPETTITVFESETEETVTIRVIKLSEVTDSTVAISKIKVTAKESIKPTQANAHRIEFIGDSITCGFGVDDSDVNGIYTTATEDASKAYSYKAAQALEADYSMVSISGYGIISGYSANGVKFPYQIIPEYYENMGFSYGYFNRSIQVSKVPWDFTRFVSDLIVINLGTNDDSYCGNDITKQDQFVSGYVAFLKQVRAKNPDATILCTLGIMGDRLYPSVEAAVTAYSEETGDTNVRSMKFDVQQANDGYGACWHPSEITHTKAAEKLTEEIKSIMGW